jgi:CheY-like chemotaxis protein
MRKRILIVDDDVCATHVLRTKLEQAGDFEVREENTSTRALPVALAFRPDFIVLDICMPQLDGGEVAAQFRAEPSLCKTPIVFATSIVLEQEIEEASQLRGRFHFLAKPVNLPKLLRLISSSA